MKRTLCALLASLLLLLCLPVGAAALEQNTAYPMYPAARIAGLATDFIAPASETPGTCLNSKATFSMTGTYNTKDNKKEGFAKGDLTTLTDGTNVNPVQWYFPQTDFFDIRGNRAAADSTHLYKSLITAELGDAKELTALSVVISGAKVASALQAGDIYISTDGETWTLTTGWDIVGYRQDNGLADKDNGAATATKNLIRTIKDAKNNDRGEYRVALNGLAKYVRIGLTAGAGKSDASQSYAGALNAVTSGPTVYGISLYGYDTTADITVSNVQNTRADGKDSYNVRFLAQVAMPCTAQKYGFAVTAAWTDADGSHTVTRHYLSDTVYSSVLADNSPVSAPDGYAWGILTLTGIPSTQEIIFRIKPCLVRQDGSLAMGEAVTHTTAG